MALMRYEVRCCCQPQKLLGWLEAPERATTVSYMIRRALILDDEANAIDGPAAIEHIELPITEIYFGSICDLESKRYRAIKAEGTPIETLRRIPGFIEAEPPDFQPNSSLVSIAITALLDSDAIRAACRESDSINSAPRS